jgi:phospholipid/cholesterol/gamma-HCH transport system ATP-binding protein
MVASTACPKIIISNLSKSFGAKKVLEDVNLTIDPKQSLVVIGGSGSGKSVLIKSIIGLITPDSGSITIDGVDVLKRSAKERLVMMQHFGVLFQGGALFDSLRVWENIAFYLLYHRNIPKNEARELAIKKLQAVGLKPEVAMMFPAELSGGMQKRVALARAIAANPSIIFFDEPTTGLDPIMTDVINELIVSCSEDLGATTIAISHDMASVRKVADKVALLYGGRIIWEGSVEEMDRTDNPYVCQFIHGQAKGPMTVDVVQ